MQWWRGGGKEVVISAVVGSEEVGIGAVVGVKKRAPVQCEE